MNVIRASRSAEDAAPANEVEGEIRGFVRKEFASVRRPPPLAESGDQGAQQVNSLIQRVAGASVLEIEKLISELQGLRDFLRSEGDRVQRDAVEGDGRQRPRRQSLTGGTAASPHPWSRRATRKRRTGLLGMR